MGMWRNGSAGALQAQGCGFESHLLHAGVSLAARGGTSKGNSVVAVRQNQMINILCEGHGSHKSNHGAGGLCFKGTTLFCKEREAGSIPVASTGG